MFTCRSLLITMTLLLCSCDSLETMPWEPVNSYWSGEKQRDYDIWANGYFARQHDKLTIVTHAVPKSHTNRVDGYCIVVIEASGEKSGFEILIDEGRIMMCGWLDPQLICLETRHGQPHLFAYDGPITYPHTPTYMECRVSLKNSPETVTSLMDEVRRTARSDSRLKDIQMWLDEHFR